MGWYLEMEPSGGNLFRWGHKGEVSMMALVMRPYDKRPESLLSPPREDTVRKWSSASLGESFRQEPK